MPSSALVGRSAVMLVVACLSIACEKAAPAEGEIGIAEREIGIASQETRPAAAMRREAMAVNLGAMRRMPQADAPAAPNLPVDQVSHLAYTYGMSLELPVERLTGVMDGHVAACRGAGLAVCQMISSTRTGDVRESLSGSLALRAEPQWLQRFMTSAQSDAANADGRVSSQSTTTEDLTRRIVDTEAALRAKRTLRDRLQQLLATRPGTLTDLLEVERELSRIQGEIDSTESNVTAMRSRVVMSALTIQYMSRRRAMAGGVFEPLREAFGGFVLAVVESTAFLVTFVGAVIPWLVFILTGLWLVIRRRRARRAASQPPPA